MTGKLGFRILFVFFALLIVPLDPGYYHFLFGGRWIHFRFQDLFRLTAWMPAFIPSGKLPTWGLASYANLGIVLVAAAGGLCWTFLGKAREDNDQLYYWLRAGVRYRLAIAMIGYGLAKLFPLQIPAPTISDLHTPYGFFLRWKIYYLSTGIASAHYTQSLGLLEVLGALLLLWRKTATIGAGILASLLFNVVVVNFAYGIGYHVYSSYLLLFALFLLSYDGVRLYRLLVLGRRTAADRFEPVFADARLKAGRRAVRWGTGLFILAYALSVRHSWLKTNWPFSDVGGLPGKAGYYNVSSFILNGSEFPYSVTDTLRWQDVVLEKWNTISVKVNRPIVADAALPSMEYRDNEERDYEQAGNGGRIFYSYSADTVRHLLVLHGKGSVRDNLTLGYEFSGGASILLSGRNERGDSLRIRLDRIEKRYLLKEGNRKPLRIN